MAGFLAYIFPVGAEPPAHPIAPGGPPPQIWPSPGYPAHPIAPGGPPPGIWPSPGHPAHPIAPGGAPPGIWPSPGIPTHPIYIPPIPPEIWPSPGVPTHPIAPGGSPGVPTHPIYFPPVEGGGEGDVPPPQWAWSPVYGWVVIPGSEGGRKDEESEDLS